MTPTLFTQAFRFRLENLNTLLTCAPPVIMTPYSGTTLAVVVTQVAIDPTGTTATVSWSKGTPGATGVLSPGSTVTSQIPPDLMAAYSYLIWCEPTFTITLNGAGQVMGPISVKQDVFQVPRGVASIPTPS